MDVWVAAGPRDAAQINAVQAGFVRHGRRGCPGWWGRREVGRPPRRTHGTADANGPGRTLAKQECLRERCSPGGTLNQQARDLIAQVSRQFDDAQAARQAGDFAVCGREWAPPNRRSAVAGCESSTVR